MLGGGGGVGWGTETFSPNCSTIFFNEVFLFFDFFSESLYHGWVGNETLPDVKYLNVMAGWETCLGQGPNKVLNEAF